MTSVAAGSALRRSAGIIGAVFSVALCSLPVHGNPPGYAIASAHPLATQAGVEVLEAGGNAFDAAIAITAALAVVEPSGSGLGGGGFYLLHDAQSGRKLFLDAREVAPLAATRDMFLDVEGRVQQDKLRAHPLAAGIPGIPAALGHLDTRYGRLGLKRDLAPALRYAREGFPVDHKLAGYISRRGDDLRQYPASAKIFLPAGKALTEGAVLRQPALADTLERIAVFGAAGFYQGKTAERLVRAVQAAGGIWVAQDLAGYKVKERNPVILDYQGWQVVTAPPPSSGGLVLGMMFNMLSAAELQSLGPVRDKHVRIEAMRRAYFDRARFMGDDDFVEVHSRGLLSPAYAKAWRQSIDLGRASASADFELPPPPAAGDGRNTTHFSVIDAEGNRVAATLSINYMLGSAFVARETGVLLNNEMDDFVAKPGVANAYGLVGGAANAIAPGKRMLSSMTPTFVESADKLAILGTPGGSRIISMVFHAIESVIAGASAEEVVSKPRYHHQYLPDEVQFEPEGLTAFEQNWLRNHGHTLKPLGYRYGNFQAVIWDLKNRQLSAASDPRGLGSAVVGPQSKAAAN